MRHDRVIEEAESETDRSAQPGTLPVSASSEPATANQSKSSFTLTGFMELVSWNWFHVIGFM